MKVGLSAAVVALMAIAGGIWMMSQGFFSGDAPQSTVFDRSVWVANKGVFDETNARDPMVGKALKLITTGMKPDQVLEVLGEPDDKSEKSWVYSAGPRQGFPTDESVLIVRFKQGQVTEVIGTFWANGR